MVSHMSSYLIERESRYKEVDDHDISAFKKILLDDDGVMVNNEIVMTANCDWTKKYKGRGNILLRPLQTDQVSEILEYCNKAMLAIVPQGGNTGLVGGCVPVFDEIVLSLQRMDKIISFDELSGVLICEAGCTLDKLNDYLSDFRYMVPLDLGPTEWCQIGGNVSTNAGGLRLIRYGSLRGSILGLEAVLPCGKVVDTLSTMRKDNTGYDIKQLFIGAEGTLGVITKVSILAVPKPSSVQLAFVSCDDYVSVQKVFIEARHRLGEILSAFEFMDIQALDLAIGKLVGPGHPLKGSRSPFYLLVETSGSNSQHDRNKLDSFLEACKEKCLLADGVIAENDSEAAALWNLRKGLGIAVQRNGYAYKYDLSLPVQQFYDLVIEARQKFGNEAKVVSWGHLGDANLHLNICVPEHSLELSMRLDAFVYGWVRDVRGSISSEHGIGQCKPQFLHYSKSLESIGLMKQLKDMIDPNNIMNPYKVLPSLK